MARPEISLLEKQGEYEVFADLMSDEKTELNSSFKLWKQYNQGGSGFKIALPS